MEKQQRVSGALLKILVCPTCKKKLTYQKAKQQLLCAKCGSYPIKEGIPVLLPKH